MDVEDFTFTFRAFVRRFYPKRITITDCKVHLSEEQLLGRPISHTQQR